MPNPHGKGGFRKGQSGNPGGRPREKPFRTALLMEISREGNDLRALRKVARALLSKSCKEDVAAIRELANRLDGPPEATSEISFSAGDGNEGTTSIQVTFVHPSRRLDEDEEGKA
jgi:hypothetical protein